MGKVRVYVAVVTSTFLHAEETWVPYSKDIQLLEHFHQWSSHSIMGIHWKNYVTNVDVLKKAGLPSIEAILLHQFVRWVTHVWHMNNSRMSKAVFYSKLRKRKHLLHTWHRLVLTTKTGR